MTVVAEEQEYRAIRERVAIREVTDLAVLEVRGARAGAVLDRVMTGTIERLVENRLMWTALLTDRGRILADVLVYKDVDSYLITCAPEAARFVADALGAGPGEADVQDLNETYAIVTVEGPDALDVPERVLGPEVAGLSPLWFTRCRVADADGLVARVGFSGEFCHYLFVAHDRVGALMERLRSAVPSAPVVHGALDDLLRLEVRSFNRRLDVPHDESALQAGLHWMIDFRKQDFVGRQAVMAEKAEGLARRLVCFVARDEVTVDRGCELWTDDRVVGYVANTGWSPAAQRHIGLAYVDDAFGWVGVELGCEAGGIELVSAPFLITESMKRAAV
jgi:aminomethyltransferase